MTDPPGSRTPTALLPGGLSSRDPLLWIGLVVWAVSLTPSFFPVLGPELIYVYGDVLGDVPSLIVLGGALFRAVRRSPSAPERRFWMAVAAAMVAWTLVRPLYLLVPMSAWGAGWDLVTDLLYLTGYLAVALGLEESPDRSVPRGGGVGLRRLETVATMVLAFALLVYFVLIPSAFAPESYASWVPSLFMYTALDAYLLTRLIVLFRTVGDERWRAPYGWLGVTAALWLLTDATEALMWRGSVPWIEPGTPWDAAWGLPALGLLFAVSSRSGAPGSTPLRHPLPHPEPWEPDGRPGLAVAGMSLPFLHLALSVAGWQATATARPREIALLVTMTVFGVLLVQHQRLRRAVARERTSERQQVGAQLEGVRRMESVGRLAAGVAHDFSNLLSVIRGRGDLLLTLPLDDLARADAGEIVEAARRGEALVGHLMTLSRRRPAVTGIHDLSRVVDDLAPLLERVLPETVSLVFQGVASGQSLVLADRGELERVVLNLVLNARDAMPGGGRILVRTGRVHVDHATARTHGPGSGGDYAVLTVEDQGPGIAPELHQSVFEPFFTTKPTGQGTGLGLSIVYAVARQAGGFARITASAGRGASIAVHFPVADGEPTDVRPRPPTMPSVGRMETILVVEDFGPLRRTTVRILESAGYRTLDASTGMDALAILERRNESVDLILVDLVLPDLSGFELHDRALRSRPALRSLFMSGYADTITPLRNSERAPVLEKPFTPEDLTGAVHRALEGDAAPPEPFHGGA